MKWVESDHEAGRKRCLGGVRLGMARPTRRLVDMGARLARQAGESMAQCCADRQAAQLGSYRFLRNEQVDVEAIARSGFAASAQRMLPQGGKDAVLCVKQCELAAFEDGSRHPFLRLSFISLFLGTRHLRQSARVADDGLPPGQCGHQQTGQTCGQQRGAQAQVLAQPPTQ